MLYESVVARDFFYTVMCLSRSVQVMDINRHKQAVRKAELVLGEELDTISPVAERMMLSRLWSIMDNYLLAS